MSLPAIPSGADAPADAATSIAPGTAFIDRAHQMVAFLAAREGGGTGAQASRRQEEELAQWISRWRGLPRRGLDGTEHFVAEELGIIARALNGPAHGNRMRPPERTDELCWLIARCIHKRP